MTTVQSPETGCLSGWRIGRLACGDEIANDATQAHIATCARCSEALSAQRTDVAAARFEAVPQHLKLPPRRSLAEAWRNRALSASLLATAACAAWLVLPRILEAPPRVTHIKGTVAMVATIKREDAIVADEVAMEKLQSLQTNDRMRLRVLAEQGQYIDLTTSDDQGHWDPVYQGVLGADRWLPVGLRLDMATPTYFKLRVCATPEDSAHCDEHIYKL